MTRKFYVMFAMMFVVIVLSMVVAGVVTHFFGGGLGVVVLVLGIGGYAVYSSYAMRQPSKSDKHVMADGVEADAVVLNVTDTQITLDDLSFVLRLHLRVEQVGAAPFEASFERAFQRGSGIPVGARLRVKYDPAKPGHVVMVGNSVTMGDAAQSQPSEPQMSTQAEVVDFMKEHGLDQAVASGQSLVYSDTMDPVEASNLLQRAEDLLQELRVSGVDTKAMVVELTKLGINVNGNNQGVKAKLTVMPEGHEAYLAEAVGIISERSWPFYQAGQSLTVKVDANDRSRVSFYKSSAD